MMDLGYTKSDVEALHNSGNTPCLCEDWLTLFTEVDRLQKLTSGRAGKLLEKGKPFIVVANDEVYFTAVYALIRESEKANGRWSVVCEQRFQELTHYDDDMGFLELTPELQSLLREQREKHEMQNKIKQLQSQINLIHSVLIIEPKV